MMLSQNLTISAQSTSHKKMQQNSWDYIPSMLIVASTHTAVILESMRGWITAPSRTATNLNTMKVGSQKRGSSTYRLYPDFWHSPSIKPPLQRCSTNTSTVRQGIPGVLPMFLTAHCTRSSVEKKLPQMERHFPIGISQITGISRSGYLSTVSPCSNAEVPQCGWSSASTTISLLTSRLTLIISSATVSSLAPNQSRMLTYFSFPFMTGLCDYLKGWMVRLICQRRNFLCCRLT